MLKLRIKNKIKCKDDDKDEVKMMMLKMKKMMTKMTRIIKMEIWLLRKLRRLNEAAILK